MVHIWFKLLFYSILLHRTLDKEQEEAPLGNIPLCGMGFYWCKMCVRLDYYAQLWQPSRSNGLQVFGLEVAHCGTGLAKAQAQALAVSVKFKVTDKGLSNVVGRRKRGNAICNGLLLLPWSLSLEPSALQQPLQFCTLSLAPFYTLFFLIELAPSQASLPPTRPCICKNTVTFRFFAKKRFQNAHCKHFTCLATASNTAKINDFTVSKNFTLLQLLVSSRPPFFIQFRIKQDGFMHKI